MASAIKILILTLFVFNSAFMAQMGCPTNDPPQTVLVSFIKAIERGDYEAARLYCTGKMADDGYLVGERLSAWCAYAKTDNFNLNTKILNVDVYEDKRFARVVFELHIYVKGTEKNVKMTADFDKRENQWFIDDINPIN